MFSSQLCVLLEESTVHMCVAVYIVKLSYDVYDALFVSNYYACSVRNVCMLSLFIVVNDVRMITHTLEVHIVNHIPYLSVLKPGSNIRRAVQQNE